MYSFIVLLVLSFSQPSLAIMNREAPSQNIDLGQLELQLSCQIVVFNGQNAPAGSVSLVSPWFSARASSVHLEVTDPMGASQLRLVPIKVEPGFLFSEKGISLLFGDTEFNAESVLSGLIATPHLDLSTDQDLSNEQTVDAYGSLTWVEQQQLL